MAYSPFTTYIPICQLNENIQARNNINSNSEYRAFLQRNGSQIREQMHVMCATNPDIRTFQCRQN